MVKFNVGDKVRKDDSEPFSNGETVVTVVAKPRNNGYGGGTDVTWLNTGSSPTFVVTSRLRLVESAPEENWQDTTESEIAVLKRLGVKFQTRTPAVQVLIEN